MLDINAWLLTEEEMEVIEVEVASLGLIPGRSGHYVAVESATSEAQQAKTLRGVVDWLGGKAERYKREGLLIRSEALARAAAEVEAALPAEEAPVP